MLTNESDRKPMDRFLLFTKTNFGCKSLSGPCVSVTDGMRRKLQPHHSFHFLTGFCVHTSFISILGIYQTYLRHISGISWANLRHILSISWEYLGHISGIPQVISCISQHILGMSGAYHGHILGIPWHILGIS